MDESTRWVEVFRTGEDFHMEFMRGLLTTNGIPVVVERQGFKDMPIILGVAAVGQLILKVPPDREREARELLEAPVETEDDA
ncbi:MAG TPA: DUF2007 domain-containing protein [Symbiobacteriaceae bacterium]|nr:DUF2007 domain-containing protein [Symbiobacteriaceae bacterium]